MTQTIGLIGLGAMGGAMARRLMETGHDVLGYDPLPEACQRAARDGVEIAADLSAIAQTCPVIVLSLPKAAFVTQVMSELVPALSTGATILDTTTSQPETSRAQYRTGIQNGYAFLDAPVSGGPSGARTGTMTMVVGGDAAALDPLRPILDRMTAKLLHIGPSGAGNAAKIANNLLCAANLVLVSEMVHMARRAGVSAEDLLTGLNAGSGRSGVSEVNFPRWILNGSYDSGFTMGLMRKDVGLAQNLAKELGLTLPGTEAIAAIWEDSRKMLPDSADFNEIYRYET
ncbi:NAD(P)-dependent oxidoreductase [Aestuariivita sp.]|jgi:3-hydroxyisobutyrate dehydrogenase|uniref:NAD(P)-dependent oxidoreductase n=1 Tax=Aestuariivita sp. TaxID=1872407 RepID=UPI00216C0D9A|nr:NAD(P)-dependent oxidoreductase [Aestuariivita sp.]MCE8009829.1 NAD(P)-dependent oxidoreductase [Aestuariivita sp.]